MKWKDASFRSPRWIENIPQTTLYKPAGIPAWSLELVELSLVMLEAVRLADLEGLTQEEAAGRMGISRRSFWKDLTMARKKIAYALSNGCAIQIIGGNIRLNRDGEDSPGPREGSEDRG
ncbi:MAG: hypothetical protein DRN37_00920 [Thermoplasmata archaeon]|nr:MAG: hypothetical protein DRN37_00920 [Thermoplasmata archaeon]